MGAAPHPRSFPRGILNLVVALVMAGPLFAGCSGPAFNADVAVWKAGYAWQYDVQTVERTRITGTPPTGFEDQATDGEFYRNATERLEVFNATANSVEGIPIYALAVLNRPIIDENSTNQDQSGDFWDAWVFSEDLNRVEPTYEDWRNQEIQLSGNEGGAGNTTASSAPDATATTGARGGSSFNQIAKEYRRLDWPLSKGHSWRHLETIPELGDIDGLFEAKSVKVERVRVPGGNFTPIRIQGTLEPLDVSDLEGQVRDSLEQGGGKVRTLSFRFTVDMDYAYSTQVENLVDVHETQKTIIHAAGRDADDKKYDFTYTQTKKTTKVLTTFQLAEGVEKPLSFALDVKRGVYSPKPITPASQLAVEILNTRQSINVADPDSKVSLGLRIYNSTGGQKKVRPSDASFAAVVTPAGFDPKYDHDMLEVRWSFQSLDVKGRKIEDWTKVADQIDLTMKDFKTPGLKNMQATLKLKDTPDGPGQEIFTDTVSFEAMYHTNLTETQAPTSTGQQSITVKFPVEPFASHLTVIAALTNGNPAQTWCPVPTGGNQGVSGDCLRIRDANNRQLPDENGLAMKMENTQIAKGSWSFGTWVAAYQPSAPSETVKFDIEVRYRPGA